MKRSIAPHAALFLPPAIVALGFLLSACSSSECVTAADCAFTEACTLDGACISLNGDAALIPQRPLPDAALNLGFVQEGRILVPHTGAQIILVQSEGRLAFVNGESGALETTVQLDGEPVQGRLLDGDRALISFRDRRAVDVVSLVDAQVTTIPLPAPATATAQTVDGRVFAALPALGEIVEIDLARHEIIGSRTVVKTPAGLEGTPDGDVMVSFFNDGITLEFDPDNTDPDESTEWTPPGVPVRRVGRPVFSGTTVELPFEEVVPILTTETSTFCASTYYAAPPAPQGDCPAGEAPMNFQIQATVPTLRTVVGRGGGSGNSMGINSTRVRPATAESPLLVAQVATAYDRYLHLTLDEGSGSVFLYTLDGEGHVPTVAFGRLQAEAGSRDLALSRDGRRVYVYNDMERSLFAFPLPAPAFRERAPGPAPVVAHPTYRKVITDAALLQSVRRGAQLFVESSDRLSGSKQFSCASCHPGGGEDGMRWGPHFTMPLLSRRDTMPFHWNNEVTQAQDLNAITIKERMGGSGLSALEMAQLFSYIETLEAPVGLDPEREDVARGAVLFHSDTLACATCHRGPAFTDGALRQVLSYGEPTATPALLGVAYTAPYMSDGSAQTLRDLVNLYVRSNHMGVGSDLSNDEVNDLIAYLRSL